MEIFTSGTTGDAKRIEFDNEAMKARIEALAKVRPPGWTEIRSIFNDQKPYSISHERDKRWMEQVGGSFYGQQETLEKTVELLLEKKPEAVCASPEYLVQFAEQIKGRYKPKFILSCTAKTTPEQAWLIMNGLGPNLWINYAATETGTISLTTGQRAIEVEGCVGRPCEGVDVLILSKSPVVDGHVLVRSKTMVGTKNFTLDGWFQTGDTGRWLLTGELVLTGRVPVQKIEKEI